MSFIRHVSSTAAAIGAALGLTACASASSSAPDGAAPPPYALVRVANAPRPDHGSYDVVLAEELRRVAAPNVFTALERTRPAFLRVRGATAALRHEAPDIDVFLNGQYAGGADVLRSIPSDFVTKIQMVQRSQGFVTNGMQLRGEHALYITLINR